jgi:hypothetical protein
VRRERASEIARIRSKPGRNKKYIRHFVIKLYGKRSHGRPRRRTECKIKTGMREVHCEDGDWLRMIPVLN